MSHIKKYSQCKTADYKFLRPSLSQLNTPIVNSKTKFQDIKIQKSQINIFGSSSTGAVIGQSTLRQLIKLNL
jgi:hypothetical protein